MLLGGQSEFETPTVRKIVNPQLNADAPTVVNVVESSENYQVFYKQADSASNTGITFNLVVPSNTLVGRTFTIEMPFSLVVTCTGTGNAYVPGYSGVRANPISQLIKSAQLSINGGATSCQVGDIIYGLNQLMSDDELALYGPAAYQDAHQDFAYSLNTNNNALSDYNSNSSNKLLTRGSLNGNSTLSPIFIDPIYNTATGYIVTGTIQEQITLLSPLISGPLGDRSKALAGVNDISLTLNLVPDAFRFWQHNSDGVFGTNATATLTVDVGTRLALEFWKPSVPYDPMEKRLYAYNNMTVYTTSGSSVASGATVEITSATQSLSCVPSKLLVWCRRDDTLRTRSTMDTFLPITNISVNYDNRNSVLASASQWALYSLARKNGLNVPWAQWSRYSGGVMVIDVAADIGVSDGEVAGTIGKHQVYIKATFKNTSSATISLPKMYVLPILPGVAVIGAGSCSYLTGIMSPEQSRALNNTSDPPAYSQTLKENSVFGSSIFSDAWDGAKYAAQLSAPTLINMAARAALGGAQVGGKSGVTVYKSKRGSGYEDVEKFDMNRLERNLQR